jgi:hypothetical protein
MPLCGPLSGSYEHGNEASGFIKGRKYTGELLSTLKDEPLPRVLQTAFLAQTERVSVDAVRPRAIDCPHHITDTWD